jgi:prepilin-type N-terminal cleavage/methylation domain-containing protein
MSPSNAFMIMFTKRLTPDRPPGSKNLRLRRRKSGFTLIELLAVILVIAVLAGILIPVIGAARERALLSKSVGNLRSIGTTFLLYANQNNKQFPGTLQDFDATNASGDPIAKDDISSIGNYGFLQAPHLLLMEGLVDDLSIFYCPAQDTLTYPDNTTHYGRQGWAKEGYYIGYVFYRLRKYSSSGADAFPESLTNKSLFSDPRVPLFSNFFPGLYTEEPLFGDVLNFVRVDGSVGQASVAEITGTGSWTERIRIMMGDDG